MNHFTLEMKELQFINELSRKSDSFSSWEGFYSVYTFAEHKHESAAGDVGEVGTQCYNMLQTTFIFPASTWYHF